LDVSHCTVGWQSKNEKRSIGGTERFGVMSWAARNCAPQIGVDVYPPRAPAAFGVRVHEQRIKHITTAPMMGKE